MKVTIVKTEQRHIKDHGYTKESLDPSEIQLKFKTHFGSDIKYYDDGIGPLWLFCDSMGIQGIIRAQSEGDAHDIIEDEFLTPIGDDDLHEAYDMDKEEFRAKAATWGPDNEGPDLAEGYSYQPNSTGTGIVLHDLNGESLKLLTVALMEQHEIEMIISM